MNRRDPAGIAVAAALLIIGALMLTPALLLDSRWWLLLFLPGVPVFAFSIIGMALSATPALRDDTGRRERR